MRNFFDRLVFWIEWSYYLRCKKCCIFCKFYKDCVADTEDLLDMTKTF